MTSGENSVIALPVIDKPKHFAYLIEKTTRGALAYMVLFVLSGVNLILKFSVYCLDVSRPV